MWRKQPDPPPAAPPAPSPPLAEQRAPGGAHEPRAEAARINQAIVVKGEINGQGDLYVDGQVEGIVRLPDSLVAVGPHGCVTAEIEANEIVIEGEVKGNVRARTRVELRRTAQVTGDVVTHRIAIHEGARFNGKIDIVRPEGAPASARSRGAAVGAESVPAVSFEAGREVKDALQ